MLRMRATGEVMERGSFRRSAKRLPPRPAPVVIAAARSRGDICMKLVRTLALSVLGMAIVTACGGDDDAADQASGAALPGRRGRRSCHRAPPRVRCRLL